MAIELAGRVKAIAEMQRVWRQREERSRTIVSDLRGTGPAPPSLSLLAEAADVIEHLQEQIKRLDRDLRDEQRESQRDARTAYDEGYIAGRHNDDAY